MLHLADNTVTVGYLLIHPMQPVGQPPAAGLEEADPQPWVPFEDAAEHETGHPEHLLTFSGVFERHPDLHVVMSEGHVG